MSGFTVGNSKTVLKLSGADAKQGNDIGNSEAQLEDVDANIPEKAWTINFCVAALNNGFQFKEIPQKMQCVEMINMLVAVSGCKHLNIAELSPKLRTKELCIAYLKKNAGKKRLLNLVPAEYRFEVEKAVWGENSE